MVFEKNFLKREKREKKWNFENYINKFSIIIERKSIL